MPYRYARRTHLNASSIFTELIEYLSDPSFISFSGGFPASHLLPVNGLKQAAIEVFDEAGSEALQYSSTWGYDPLRKWIAHRYEERCGLKIDYRDILMTTGSQQALDLIGKVFLDPKDDIIVEYPSYLGALQSFAMFEANFHEVTLNEDGLDLEQLKKTLQTHHPKLLYMVPNFQNPTGISYSSQNRSDIVKIIQQEDILLVEDDPYGELRYEGVDAPLFKQLCPDKTLLMGSFSKIVAPGMRLGWVVARKEIAEKLFVAKEASDLHASNLDQRIVYQYLLKNDIQTHLHITKTYYAKQRQSMLSAIRRHFPKEVRVAESQGGMFFWVTLPQGLGGMDLFREAVKAKVVFIPGDPFYVSARNVNTFRLNYTSADPALIEEGIRRLGAVIDASLSK